MFYECYTSCQAAQATVFRAGSADHLVMRRNLSSYKGVACCEVLASATTSQQRQYRQLSSSNFSQNLFRIHQQRNSNSDDTTELLLQPRTSVAPPPSSSPSKGLRQHSTHPTSRADDLTRRPPSVTRNDEANHIDDSGVSLPIPVERDASAATAMSVMSLLERAASRRSAARPRPSAASTMDNRYQSRRKHVQISLNTTGGATQTAADDGSKLASSTTQQFGAEGDVPQTAPSRGEIVGDAPLAASHDDRKSSGMGSLARKLLQSIRSKRVDRALDAVACCQEVPPLHGDNSAAHIQVLQTLRSLPALKHWRHLLRLMSCREVHPECPMNSSDLNSTRKLIVSGYTGCGKSVLVPLLALDEHWSRLETRLLLTFPDLEAKADSSDTDACIVGDKDSAKSRFPLRQIFPAEGDQVVAERGLQPFTISSRDAFMKEFAQASRVRIYVTQPTRIACVNLARFLGDILEALAAVNVDADKKAMSSPCSDDLWRRRMTSQRRRVGYAVAHDSDAAPGTEVVFATPQYLLNLLQLRVAYFAMVVQRHDHQQAANSNDAVTAVRGVTEVPNPATHLPDGSQSRGRVISAEEASRARQFIEGTFPTAVLLDEVHKRDMFTDLLLLWCRLHSSSSPLLSAHSNEPRNDISHLPTSPLSSVASVLSASLRMVVAMSATADTGTLQRYLGVHASSMVDLGEWDDTTNTFLRPSHPKTAEVPLFASAELRKRTQRKTQEAMLNRPDAARDEANFTCASPVAAACRDRHLFPVDVLFAEAVRNKFSTLQSRYGALRSDSSSTASSSAHSNNNSAKSQLWQDLLRRCLSPQMHDFTVIKGLRALDRRFGKPSLAEDDCHSATRATSNTATSSKESALELSAASLQAVASLAVLMAINPPSVEGATGEALNESGDDDEEDRVLLFVPGLAEVLTVMSALERMDRMSKRRQSFLSGNSGMPLSPTQLLGDDYASPSQTTSSAYSTPLHSQKFSNLKFSVGSCDIEVTLLHSSAIGESSRALAELPTGANRRRTYPAVMFSSGGSVSGGGKKDTARCGSQSTTQGVFRVDDAAIRRCRLIVATNVAESSLTIPGLRCVIDTCLERCVHADPWTHGSTVRTELITHSSLLQRRGRAGRTGPGVVLHLIPESVVARLRRAEVPETRSGSPAQLVLLAKLFFSGNMQRLSASSALPADKVIALLPSPPSTLACLHGAEQLFTHRCIRLLFPDTKSRTTEALAPRQQPDGSLAAVGEGVADELTTAKMMRDATKVRKQIANAPALQTALKVLHCGILTQRGYFLASMPIDHRFALLIYYGGVFGAVEDALLLACAMSVPNLFLPVSRAVQLQRLREFAGMRHRLLSATGSEVSSAEEDAVTAVDGIRAAYAHVAAFRELSGGSLSEPLALLNLMKLRYESTSRVDFEHRLALNSVALSAVDHAVASCSERLLQAFRSSDRFVTTSASHDEWMDGQPVSDAAEEMRRIKKTGGHLLTLPTEWAHRCRSDEAKTSIAQLRAAALDRITYRAAAAINPISSTPGSVEAKCVLATWSSLTTNTDAERDVLHRRLLSSFVAAFGSTNLLRAEESMFPMALRRLMEHNTDALMVDPSREVAVDTTRLPCEGRRPPTPAVCFLRMQGYSASSSLGGEVGSSALAKAIRVNEWPAAVVPSAVVLFERMKRLCVAFSPVPAAVLSPTSAALRSGPGIEFAAVGISTLRAALENGPALSIALPSHQPHSHGSAVLGQSDTSKSGVAEAKREESSTVTAGGLVTSFSVSRRHDWQAADDGDTISWFNSGKPRLLQVRKLRSLGYSPILPSDAVIRSRLPQSLSTTSAGAANTSTSSSSESTSSDAPLAPSATATAAAVLDRGVAATWPVVCPKQVNWVAVTARPPNSAGGDSGDVPTTHVSTTRWRCPACQADVSVASWDEHVTSLTHLDCVRAVAEATVYTMEFAVFAHAVVSSSHSAPSVVAPQQSPSSSSSVAATHLAEHFIARVCRLPATSLLNVLQFRLQQDVAENDRSTINDSTAGSLDGCAAGRPGSYRRVLIDGRGFAVAGSLLSRAVAAQLDAAPVTPPSDRLCPASSLKNPKVEDGDDEADALPVHSFDSALVATNVWVLDMHRDAIAIAQGLVVAASTKTVISILTDFEHTLVYAMLVDRCAVFPFPEPLDRLALQRLEVLFECGSAREVGRRLRTSQQQRDSDTNHSPAAAPPMKSSESTELHWCSLTSACPSCTYLHHHRDAAQIAKPWDGKKSGSVGMSHHHLPSIIADGVVADMFLLLLHRMLEMRIRRVRLADFVTELLELLQQCATTGALPLPISPAHALRQFLMRRDETIEDVLTSLGCMFHVNDDGRTARGHSTNVRFYPPPLLPSLFPAARLRDMLHELQTNHILKQNIRVSGVVSRPEF